jgi:putative ABC transport system permease protein
MKGQQGGKMYLARRNLLQDKLRFALSVAGVALAVMLILLLNGVLSGIYQQIAAYYQNTPGSIVVIQKGAATGGNSMLPRGTTDAIRHVEGVGSVIPVLSQYFFLDLHDRKVTVLVTGYDPTLGGGPWQLVEGREPQQNDEVVIDRVLAQRHAIAVGNTLNAMGLSFTVVGLSDGTSSVIGNYVFVRKAAVESLLFASDLTSLVFVTPATGTSPDILRERLSAALPDVDVLPKNQVIANIQKAFARVFAPPLQLMVGIAFLVGTLVVGLVIYTASSERQREYGVLKAIGARNGLLYRVVIIQALIAAGVGAVLGIGFAWLAGRLITALRPEFWIALDPAAATFALAAGLIMALFAALFPARLVAGLAPAEVFRRA